MYQDHYRRKDPGWSAHCPSHPAHRRCRRRYHRRRTSHHRRCRCRRWQGCCPPTDQSRLRPARSRRNCRRHCRRTHSVRAAVDRWRRVHHHCRCRYHQRRKRHRCPRQDHRCQAGCPPRDRSCPCLPRSRRMCRCPHPDTNRDWCWHCRPRRTHRRCRRHYRQHRTNHRRHCQDRHW